MVIVYNKRLQPTPFQQSHKLLMPCQPKNPFEPDDRTLKKVLYRRS